MKVFNIMILAHKFNVKLKKQLWPEYIVFNERDSNERDIYIITKIITKQMV